MFKDTAWDNFSIHTVIYGIVCLNGWATFVWVWQNCTARPNCSIIRRYSEACICTMTPSIDQILNKTITLWPNVIINQIARGFHYINITFFSEWHGGLSPRGNIVDRGGKRLTMFSDEWRSTMSSYKNIIFILLCRMSQFLHNFNYVKLKKIGASGIVFLESIDFDWFVALLELQIVRVYNSLKLFLWGSLYHPFGFTLFWHFRASFRSSLHFEYRQVTMS